jgi:hypothetical protein
MAGKTPLAGVTVAMSGSATGSTTTRSDGTYSFTGLTAGSYTLTPSMAGYTFKPTNIKVTLNKNLTGQSFAATALPTYSISGTVKEGSGAPLAKVTMALSGTSSAETQTASDGTYSFSGLSKGSYVVTPSLAGYSFSPQKATVPISGRDMTENFVATALLSISGSVLTVGGGPFSGVTVNLSGAAKGGTTTGADGSYSFTGLLKGLYTLKPSEIGYTFLPPGTTITLNKNATGQNFTATASISGTVEAGGGSHCRGDRHIERHVQRHCHDGSKRHLFFQRPEEGELHTNGI